MRRWTGRLVALGLGSGLVLVAVRELSPVPPRLLPDLAKRVLANEPTDLERGFRAYHVFPPTDEDQASGGYTWTRWDLGPHDRFAELGAEWLARESLDWFRDSQPAFRVASRGGSADLELVYVSDGIAIQARYDEGNARDWADQLRGWFEAFPPTGSENNAAPRARHSWMLDFEGGSRVRGHAEGEWEAVEGMRVQAIRHEDSATHRIESFWLLGERGAGIQARTVDQLDGLPARLRRREAEG